MGKEAIKVTGSIVCCGVVGGVVGGAVGAVATGLIAGSVGALTGTISGSAGAALMQTANYTGYDVTEAAQMGAIGSGVLSASLGVLAGGIYGTLGSCGLFPTKKSATTSGLLCYTIGGVAGGLLGYGILNRAEQHTIMQLQETAIAFAVGSVTTCIPLTLAVICILGPIALAYAYRAEEELDSVTLPPHRKNYGSFKRHQSFYSKDMDLKSFW